VPKKIIEIGNESLVVKRALSNIIGLNEPNLDIKKYLEDMGRLNEKDGKSLEEYLAVYSSWQNYFAEKLVIAEAIKVVAHNQREYYYSLAVDKASGTINAKKDVAKVDEAYLQACDIYEQSKTVAASFQTKFDACERGFRLVSRILTRRLKVTEF
jgi:hypothetical protein